MRSISTAPRWRCSSTRARDTPAPFAFAEIGPKWVGTHSTHAIAPEAVLEVYARTLGKTPPPSFTLCVRGETFELGEGLSAEAAERLEAAWDVPRGADARADCRSLARAPSAPGCPSRRMALAAAQTNQPASVRFQSLRRQNLQLLVPESAGLAHPTLSPAPTQGPRAVAAPKRRMKCLGGGRDPDVVGPKRSGP